VKTYRTAIDDYFQDPLLYEIHKPDYLAELKLTTHRGFTSSFFEADVASVEVSGQETHGSEFLGIVKSYDAGAAVIEQRGKFSVGEELEFFRAAGPSFKQIFTEMRSLTGELVLEAPHPRQLVKVKVDYQVSELDILRRLPERR
jgi:putative protease